MVFGFLPTVVAALATEQPVAELLSRVLPAYAPSFDLTLDAALPPGVSTSFAVSTTADGRVHVRGSSQTALAAGAHAYLRAVNASVSWAATGGDNLVASLPASSKSDHLPPLPHALHGNTSFLHVYYFNTCTYGYSTPWWSWERWERELDWMALHAINTPLAMLGFEWAMAQTLTLDFGLARSDLDDFLSGPAFLPWHWMGNLDAWGGPLSDGWLERGRALQHRFLTRARSLGMTPVLPAFAGFVPPAMQSLFPDAEIQSTSGWNGFAKTFYLEPSSPLFGQVGAAFIQRLCAEFGCDEGWFAADLYNELAPPSKDPEYLRNASRATYAAIEAGFASHRRRQLARRAAAPSAAATSLASATRPTWLAQAWMWHNDPSHWGTSQIRAFLDGPPVGGLVMLDLYAEVRWPLRTFEGLRWPSDGLLRTSEDL